VPSNSDGAASLSVGCGVANTAHRSSNARSLLVQTWSLSAKPGNSQDNTRRGLR
jgi:hypothetical protein